MDDTWVNEKPSMILRLPDERSETDNNLDYLGHLDYLVKIKAYTM